MEKTQKLENAWAWARDARLTALRQKRERFAAPRNPFEPRPGMEADFERVNRDITALNTILGAIEDAHSKARGEAVKRKALQLRDVALAFGLASLATLGIAAACITVGAPDPITQASAVIGTSLSLGWALKIAWK